MTNANRCRGLTLLELLVVLAILIALATLLVPMVSFLGQRSQEVSSHENLYRLQDVLVNHYLADMGELPRPAHHLVVSGTRRNHPQLAYLFLNPDYHEDGIAGNDHDTSGNLLSQRSWRGPYLLHGGAGYAVTDTDSDAATGTNFTNRYGENGDPTVLDAWGRPIVLQEPDANGDGAVDEDEARHVRLVSAGPNGRIDADPDLLMPTKTERGDDQVAFLFRNDEYGDAFLKLER